MLYQRLHCVRRVFGDMLVAARHEFVLRHNNPSHSAAVHRQLPTPRYAPLAADGYQASVT
jgi:hypothetical protein